VLTANRAGQPCESATCEVSEDSELRFGQSMTRRTDRHPNFANIADFASKGHER
jgi:hypothetical protein